VPSSTRPSDRQARPQQQRLRRSFSQSDGTSSGRPTRCPDGCSSLVPKRNGLPPGHEFSVVTNLRDHKGTVEQVFVRVTSIRDGLISGKPIMMIAMTLSLNASLRFVGMTSGQGVGSLMVQLAKYH